MVKAYFTGSRTVIAVENRLEHPEIAPHKNLEDLNGFGRPSVCQSGTSNGNGRDECLKRQLAKLRFQIPHLPDLDGTEKSVIWQENHHFFAWKSRFVESWLKKVSYVKARMAFE